MRVLMTGATGFIGRAAARELTDGGHEVVVVCRDPNRARASLSFAKGFHAWDALSGIFPADAWQGVEAVVHLAGEGIADGRWDEARKRALYDSRIVGTRALLESLRDHARAFPRVFVSASAVGCYGLYGGSSELTEESRLGDDYLAELTRAWEEEAKRAPAKRIVCLRFGMVLGKGGALARMLPIFRAGLGGKLGNGRQWMSWIHVADAARLVRKSIEDETFTGPVNAVAPEPVTNSAFTRALAGALRRPALFPVPRFALRLALGELAPYILASQRVVPRKAERLGFEFRYRDLPEALQEIVGG